MNEAETLASCIEEIRAALQSSGLRGEIIVSDNGSVDDSVQIAKAAGAKVVHSSPAGYGVALSTGIAAASSDFVAMGDADGSYDFADIPHFVAKLHEGFDIVIGNRFLGGVMPGAMPWSHRWLGNPVLSLLGRFLFPSPIGDFHCGLRAIRKRTIETLDLRSQGMEFASEMIVRSTLANLRITEIPTTLRPDGRSRSPHLRSIPDGWRHLKFLFLLCPRWLFVVPGYALLAFGLFFQMLLIEGGGLSFTGINFGINTSLATAAAIFFGIQLIGSNAVIESIRKSVQPRGGECLDAAMMDRIILAGAILAMLGTGLFVTAVFQWSSVDFSDLPSELAIQRTVPSVILMTTGAEIIGFAFLAGAIDQILPKKKDAMENSKETKDDAGD